MGHGRALVSVENKELQLEYYKKILAESLSVRATETLINKNQKHDSTVIKEIPKNILKDKIRISKNLNLDVKISLKSNNKGSISISFNNIEDYKKIIKKLSSENKVTLLSLFFLVYLTSYSQENELRFDDLDPTAPSKAAFYSAVIPGLGQGFNKKILENSNCLCCNWIVGILV